MLRKTFIVPSAFLLALGAHSTIAYDAEVTGSYGFGDIEQGSADADITAYGIGGEFYFGGVDDSNGPLAEAEFIDRASSIFASYENVELDFDGGDSDADSFSFGGLYVDKEVGWFAGASYTTIDEDDSDSDTFSVRAGAYIAELSAVGFSYSFEDDDEIESDIFAVDFQHLEKLEGEQALKFDAALGYISPDELDETTVLSGSVTYYVDNTLGFGGGLSFANSDDSDETAYELFVTWFPVPNVELTANYTSSEDDDSDLEIDLFELGAAVRF